MNKLTLSLTSLLILTISNQAFCFSFGPMNMTLDQEGKKATGVFVLESKATDIVPIQISIEKRMLDAEGKETTAPLDPTDKFLIYPPMISLGPNEKRMVKIVYMGPKDLQVEKSYRLWATQLPVKNYEKDKDKSQLKILSRYGASLYVAPFGAKPKVEMLEARRVEDKNPKLLMTFENHGTAHENLMYFSIKITGKNKSYTIEWKDIKSTFTSINVFPKQKRSVSMPWNAEFPTGPLTCEIQPAE